MSSNTATNIHLNYNEQNLRDLETFLSPARFKRAVETGVSRGLRKASIYLAKEMRKRITRQEYAPNAPLTVLFKGHARPLIGGTSNDLSGNNMGLSPRPTSESLYKSISWTRVSRHEYHVGSYKVGASGRYRDRVSDLLHGDERGGFYEINVTEKMARYLRIRWQQLSAHTSAEAILAATKNRQKRARMHGMASTAGGNLRTGGKIRIPHRPWVGKVVVERRIQDNVFAMIWKEVILSIRRREAKYLSRMKGI